MRVGVAVEDRWGRHSACGASVSLQECKTGAQGAIIQNLPATATAALLRATPPTSHMLQQPGTHFAPLGQGAREPQAPLAALPVLLPLAPPAPVAQLQQQVARQAPPAPCHVPAAWLEARPRRLPLGAAVGALQQWQPQPSCPCAEAPQQLAAAGRPALPAPQPQAHATGAGAWLPTRGQQHLHLLPLPLHLLPPPLLPLPQVPP